MKRVDFHKDKRLSREELAAIAKILYGGDRWYAEFARDLSALRGDGPIAPAVIHGWMNIHGRYPPWWATALVYRLLAERKAAFEVRAKQAGDWTDALATDHMKRDDEKLSG